MARDAAFEALGQQLFYLREAAGLTLTEAASRLGVHKSTLSNVEHGRDRPSTKIVEFYDDQLHGDGQARDLYVAAVTAPRPPQRRPLEDRPHYPIPGDAVVFVADVTVPDGTVMPPYFEFEKIWRVRNSGTVPWVGRWLARRGAPGGHGIPISPYRRADSGYAAGRGSGHQGAAAIPSASWLLPGPFQDGGRKRLGVLSRPIPTRPRSVDRGGRKCDAA